MASAVATAQYIDPTAATTAAAKAQKPQAYNATARTNGASAAAGPSPAGSDEYMFKIPMIGNHNVGKTSLVCCYKHLNSAKENDKGEYDENNDVSFDGSLSGSGIKQHQQQHRRSSTNTMSGFRKRMLSIGESHHFDISNIAPTIGIDFTSLVVPDLVSGVVVRAQFWDTAGMERYAAMNNVAYRNASGAVIVFDMSAIETLESVETKWLPAVLDAGVEEESVLIVANKSDLVAATDLNNSDKNLSHSGLTHEAKVILSRITHKHNVSVIQTSALDGTNVARSLDLLLKRVLEQVMENFGETPPEEVHASKQGYRRPSLARGQSSGTHSPAQEPHEQQPSAAAAAAAQQQKSQERKASYDKLSGFSAFQSGTYSPAENDDAKESKGSGRSSQEQHSSAKAGSSGNVTPKKAGTGEQDSPKKTPRHVRLVSKQEHERHKALGKDKKEGNGCPC